MATHAGIDLGTDRLHCVAISDHGEVLDSGLFGASELDAAVKWAARAQVVAVDAPSNLSTGPHGDDASLKPKFRSARCAEIALGREFGFWVPWATPTGPPIAPWMEHGFRLFAALRSARIPHVIEVYPYAAYRRLARGAALPKKSTAQGALRRAALLEQAGVRAPHLRVWSHDGLDAAVAAVVARDRALGHAVAAGCGHDDSAIWLPEQPARPAT